MVRDDFNIVAVYIPSEKEDNMIKKAKLKIELSENNTNIIIVTIKHTL